MTPESSDPVVAADRRHLASLVAFASIGTITTAQDLAAAVLDGVPDARPDVVAEETLCLVSTAAARAAAFGLRDRAALASEGESLLLEVPFTWRDYHVAGEMLDRGATAPPDEAEAIYERLGRKMAFYTAHLAPGQLPGERMLTDKMALWMGRVSPPGLSEMPDARLARLGLVARLVLHVRLVRQFASQPGT